MTTTLLHVILIATALICFCLAASSRPTRGWNAEPAGLALLTLALLLYLLGY